MWGDKTKALEINTSTILQAKRIELIILRLLKNYEINCYEKIRRIIEMELRIDNKEIFHILEFFEIEKEGVDYMQMTGRICGFDYSAEFPRKLE